MLTFSPAVFAVEREYQILTLVNAPCLFWVQVGERCFYDEQNGVMRSDTEIHRVHVPMEELDRAGSYTVFVRPIVDRKPYFTQTQEVQSFEFAFKAVPADHVRAYHIADAHGLVKEPIAAANAFGEIDVLILNGDLISYCNEAADLYGIFEIMDALTHGEIPIVYARGNHDLRGCFAEHRTAYTPLANGKPYYTFRLGSIWGVILDCGEDKPDDHEEYGGTSCCHAFREEQTDFLRRIIAEKVYEQDGVATRLVISHNPFTRVNHPPFDIETELYHEWARLIKDHIRPDLMLCGHLHDAGVYPVGGELDHLGQPCEMVIGSTRHEHYFAGVGIVFENGVSRVTLTDCFSKRQIL